MSNTKPTPDYQTALRHAGELVGRLANNMDPYGKGPAHMGHQEIITLQALLDSLGIETLSVSSNCSEVAKELRRSE